MELYLVLAGALCTVVLGALYFKFGPDNMPKDAEFMKDGRSADMEQEPHAEAANLTIEVGKTNAVRRVLPVIFIVHVAEALFLTNYYNSPIHDMLLLLFYLAILWSLAYYDYRFHIIPNRILLAACIVRAVIFAAEFAVYGFNNILSMMLSILIAAGGLVVAASLCRLISPRSVGFGDVKLLVVTGLYLGLDKTFGVMLPSLIIMFFMAVYLLAFKKVSRQTEMPFAPFLLLGTIIGGFLFGV